MYFRIYFNFFCILLCVIEVVLVSNRFHLIILGPLHHDRYKNEDNDRTSCYFYRILLPSQTLQIKRSKWSFMSCNGRSHNISHHDSVSSSRLQPINLRRLVLFNCDGYSQRICMVTCCTFDPIWYVLEVKMACNEKSCFEVMRTLRHGRISHKEIKTVYQGGE